MNVTILESTAYVRTHVLRVMGRILFVCCKERPLVGDKEKTCSDPRGNSDPGGN